MQEQHLQSTTTSSLRNAISQGAIPNDVTISIQAVVNNLYVTAEFDYAEGNFGMLRARSNAVGPWERFVIRGPLGCDQVVSIQSAANNLYVTAEFDYSNGNFGMLRARSNAVGPWEQFNFAFA
jgi:hypothetical protein